MVKQPQPQEEPTQPTQPIQGRSLDAPGVDPLTVTIETKDQNLGGMWRADRLVKGMQFKIILLRVNPADYGTTPPGINVLTAVRVQLGLGKIYAVVPLCWHTNPAPTATLKPFVLIWDHQSGTIRAFKGSAGALTEIAGADIAANDMIRCIFIGG